MARPKVEVEFSNGKARVTPRGPRHDPHGFILVVNDIEYTIPINMMRISDMKPFKRMIEQVLHDAFPLLDHIRKEIENLQQMKDQDIDTSDIPEITDLTKAEVGKFYRGKKFQK